MKYQVCAVTIKGRRHRNEDSYKAVLTDKNHSILTAYLVVADGMGGMAGGKLASQVAVQNYEESLLDAVQDLDEVNINTIKDIIKNIYRKVNNEVYRKGNESISTKDMGTTLTSVLVFDKIYIVANVGDSRAYLVNSENIARLTKDHTALNDALEKGLISEGEAANYHYANALTQFIGGKEEPVVDIFSESIISNGDTLLVCSDGFYKFHNEHYIKERLNSTANLTDILHELVNIAFENGSDDNITVAALRYGDSKMITIGEYATKKTYPKIVPKILNIFVGLLICILIILGYCIIEELGLIDKTLGGKTQESESFIQEQPLITDGHKEARELVLPGQNDSLISPFETDTIVEFGSLMIYTSKVMHHSIYNKGDMPIEVTSLYIDGEHKEAFQLNTQYPLSIQPGGEKVLSISFSAITAGEKKAVMVIETNVDGGEQFAVSLSGTGLSVGNAAADIENNLEEAYK